MTSTAVANPRATFVRELDQRLPVWQPLLPPNITVERFRTVVMTAVFSDPALFSADRKSLFHACALAAKDGLLPDKREAALVAYGSKITYVPMYQGLLKRARQSGEIASVRTHVVYEHDTFSVVFGDNEKIEHIPNLKDRGEIVGAYCIVALKSGEVVREIMTRTDLDKIRATSKAKHGPWVDWFDEMARKSVFRRASKWLPWSSGMPPLSDEDDRLTVDAADDFADQFAPDRVEADGEEDALPGSDEPDVRTLLGERMS
jgi:recombination protein RecT